MAELEEQVNELESKVNTLKEDKDALKEQLDGSQERLEMVEPRVKENTAKGDSFPNSAVLAHASQQTISDISNTKIQFDGETYDINDEFDSSTNYRFTAKNGGYYVATVVLGMGTISSGTQRQLSIEKNGSGIAYDFQYGSSQSAGGFTQILTTSRHLNSGDYLEAYIRHDEGSSVYTMALGNETNYFLIYRIF